MKTQRQAIVVLNQLVRHGLGQKVVKLTLEGSDLHEMLEDAFHQCSSPESKTAPFPSMSSGDLVIFTDTGESHLCDPFGWKKLQSMDLDSFREGDFVQVVKGAFGGNRAEIVGVYPMTHSVHLVITGSLLSFDFSEVEKISP